MKLLTAAATAVILCATSPAWSADDVAPVSPPTHYTIDLTVDQVNLLFSVFPAAEMPQNKWSPLSQAIQSQVMKQQAASAAALDAYITAHKPTKK